MAGMVTDQLAIYFEIPARDSMGYLHVNGKLRALEDEVLLHWKIKDRTFKKSGKEMQTIPIGYADIEHVEIVSRFLFNKDLVLKVHDPRLINELPGSEMGKVQLQITKKSKPDAAKFIKQVEFKMSEINLNRSLERLHRAQAAGDEPESDQTGGAD